MEAGTFRRKTFKHMHWSAKFNFTSKCIIAESAFRTRRPTPNGQRDYSGHRQTAASGDSTARTYNRKLFRQRQLFFAAPAHRAPLSAVAATVAPRKNGHLISLNMVIAARARRRNKCTHRCAMTCALTVALQCRRCRVFACARDYAATSLTCNVTA